MTYCTYVGHLVTPKTIRALSGHSLKPENITINVVSSTFFIYCPWVVLISPQVRNTIYVKLARTLCKVQGLQSAYCQSLLMPRK